jgi:HSP90 family molecular chaperone
MTASVVGKMQSMFEKDKGDPRLGEYSELFYGQGLLTEGSSLPDPARYAKLVAGLMA